MNALPRHTCQRCGHVWVPRTERKPAQCPNCKQPGWDRPARTKKERKNTMETFYKTIDGEQVSITLYSLGHYEANGGTYDDSGNGGEAVDKSDFLCAATVTANPTGYPDNDILEMAGCRDYWLDSVTDYFLLREWPADAPLAARANVS